MHGYTVLQILITVSILGLARSPTCGGYEKSSKGRGFNTWAREEPNSKQYSSGTTYNSFNTWAREEPNI